MYEEETFENILQRVFKGLDTDFDIREGSLLYNAITPVVWELAEVYIALKMIFERMYADTAPRAELIRRAKERGIIPYQATAAIGQGEFNCDIPLQSRFSLNDTNWTVIEKIGNGIYKMQCETKGRIGNNKVGDMEALEYNKELEYAKLTKILIPGEDEEETEHFRKRYFNSLISQAYGGNIADYREKVTAIAGIGGVKVYPVWNGGGTVKLVIINSDYAVPTPALTSKVQEVIDPPEKTGQGYGVAPIGHQVTIVPVTEKKIHLEFNLSYQVGYHFESVKASIEQTVDAYFYDLNKTWADNKNLVIRVARLESRILDLPGILDVTGTWINGDTKNMVLLPDEIAVRGDVIGTGN